MSVSLKSRLSYAWARATHKDRIYTHVFEKHLSIPVHGEFSDALIGYDRGTLSQWYKAVPLDSRQADQFLIFGARYQKNLSGLSIGGKYRETQLTGVWTRKQVEECFKKWEADQIKLAPEGVAPTLKQPFKAYIKTSLTTP
jgi:hypothetical protein